MSAERVLLVDDETEFLDALAERLQSRGLVVETAVSGEEALSRIEKQAERFHAVVLDLAMPGMDGIETLKRLRAADPDLQIMLLTGQATVRAAVEATKLGAMDILEKPTEIDVLVSHIRDARQARMALDLKRSQEEINRIMRTKGW